MSRATTGALSTGFAMFSMFFGAGNITFPLIVGKLALDGLGWALFGLILMAVCIPFSGLIAITLFEGNYESFFRRIGKWPGLCIIAILLAMIGPFGGIPRCITLTFSTLKVYFPSLHLLPFTLLSSALIFLCCWRKSRLIDLTGLILSPTLLLFLVIIILKGAFFSPSDPMQTSLITHPFFYGLKEGYNTMDLLAAFFFSSLVCQKLRGGASEKRSLLIPVLKASIIGASLLAIIYVGFSYVAAFHAQALEGVAVDQLLGRIGQVILGSYGGLVVCMAIALTCLTTAIALTVVAAEFLQKKISRERLSYKQSLITILLITLLVSTLKFTGIVKVLAPILQVLYPSLLVLSLLNIFHKTFDYKPVKFPVFATFCIVVYFQYL